MKLIALSNDNGECYVDPEKITGIEGAIQKKGRSPAHAVKLAGGGAFYVHHVEANRLALVAAGVLAEDSPKWGKAVEPKRAKPVAGKRGRPKKDADEPREMPIDIYRRLVEQLGPDMADRIMSTTGEVK